MRLDGLGQPIDADPRIIMPSIRMEAIIVSARAKKVRVDIGSEYMRV